MNCLDPDKVAGLREKRRGPSFKCAACEAHNVLNVEDLEEAGWYQPLDSHNPDDLVDEDNNDSDTDADEEG